MTSVLMTAGYRSGPARPLRAARDADIGGIRVLGGRIRAPPPTARGRPLDRPSVWRRAASARGVRFPSCSSTSTSSTTS